MTSVSQFFFAEVDSRLAAGALGPSAKPTDATGSNEQPGTSSSSSSSSSVPTSSSVWRGSASAREVLGWVREAITMTTEELQLARAVREAEKRVARELETLQALGVHPEEQVFGVREEFHRLNRERVQRVEELQRRESDEATRRLRVRVAETTLEKEFCDRKLALFRERRRVEEQQRTNGPLAGPPVGGGRWVVSASSVQSGPSVSSVDGLLRDFRDVVRTRTAGGGRR